MIELAETTSPMFAQEPLTWAAFKLDGVLTARVSCFRGHSGLIPDHDIAADGTVSPSLACTWKGCHWHEFIRLTDWKPEEVETDG